MNWTRSKFASPQVPAHNCEDEAKTQHWQGAEYGHGPVQDPETVLFVVFEKSSYDQEAMLLKSASFKKKRLISGDESIARKKHTLQSALIEKVVEPQRQQRGELVGIAHAEARRLRALETHVQGKAEAVRGICVLDKVEQGDHDGHGTLKFSDAVDVISPPPIKGALRDAIMADLAEVFSPVLPMDNVYPSLRGRALSLAQHCWEWLTRRALSR